MADDPSHAPGGADRRGATWFWAVALGLWLVLAVMAYLTPIILDDWYQVGWLHHHGLTPSSVYAYAHYNYFHYNPRLGETLLLLVNGPWPIHVVVTPAIELGLVVLVHAVAFGRWPRPCVRDARSLLIVQALLWVSAPAPGLLWFYRPFTTNYLFGFALQLLLLVPYRFALAGRGPTRVWLVPAVAALGFAAGLTNEHTGPATIVAIVVCAVVIVRRGAAAGWIRRAWLASGALGLVLGYAALYLAPGQRERYGGTGAVATPLGSLMARGVVGSYEAIARLVVHAQAGIVLALAVIGFAAVRAARRGAPVPGPDRDGALGIGGLVLWAGAITSTMLLSPLIGERLYLAPAILLVLACVVAIAPVLAADRGLARVAGGVAAALVAVHAVVFLEVQLAAHADAADRLARLERAPAGTVAVVPPFRHVRRARWFWGDDFVYASLREYVAHDVFGLAGIELEGSPAWAEPTPPYRFSTTYRYQPPLDRAQLAALVDLPDYTPTYWEWVIAQLRRRLPALREVDGHELQEITVTVASDDPAVARVLHGRPLLADRWRDGAWSFVYSHQQHDASGWPRFVFVDETLPEGLTDSYLVACGEARPIQVDRGHLVVAFAPRCDDAHLAILCTPRECWLGGNFWRVTR
jgi:Family of unknown function (DUF6056)